MDAMVVTSNPQLPAVREPGLIDPRAVFGLIRRRLIPILATMAVVLTATLAAYLSAEPQYLATARVALDRRSEEIVTVNGSNPPLATDSPSVDTEVQVLLSPSIAAAVVDRLKLASKPGFGFAEDGKPGDPATARERSIGIVMGGLKVNREGTSYAIAVNYSHADPQLAAAIVNAAVDSYVDGQRSGKSVERNREIALLRERLGQLRTEVMEAETAVARYRAGTNLLDLQEDRPTALATLQTLRTQLAQARAEQATASARSQAAVAAEVSDVLQSPVVRQLRTEQARLRAERADLSGRYGDKHPVLANLDRQLGEIDRNLEAELTRVRSGVNSEAQIAGSRVASLESAIANVQSQLLAANNASVRLNELQRNAESARSLYQAVLDRYRQSVAAQGTETSNAYVIAFARVPGQPYSPNLLAYLVGGTVASLLAAAFVALLLETMERGFRTRAGLEQTLGIPALSAVPDIATVRDAPLKKGSPLAIADHLVAHPGSVFDESFRSIRTSLKIGHDDQMVRSLAVTSALPDEGKTTDAICLARSAALAGLRVLLVDCDLRRRATSRTLANRLEWGLAEVLKGEVPLEQAIVRDGASGAHFLPQKPSEEPHYDLLASRTMGKLIDQLEEIYDLVIIDTAPVLPVAEARAVAAMTDGVLLVVKWRKTPAQAARMAVDQLRREGAKLMGAVLSQVDLRSAAAADMGEEVHYYRSYSDRPIQIGYDGASSATA